MTRRIVKHSKTKKRGREKNKNPREVDLSFERKKERKRKRLVYVATCLRSQYVFEILNRFTHLGPDHLQLTLLNWDTESVLALNKKLKFPIHFQFFI